MTFKSPYRGIQRQRAQHNALYAPLVTWHLSCNGINTGVNCGSDASINNLPNGAILTIDGWFRNDDAIAAWSCIMEKRNGADGWGIFVANVDFVYFNVRLSVANVEAYSVGTTVRDGRWHHIACTYVDATQTGRIAVDGIWHVANVGNGAYQLDAANSLFMGVESTGAYPFEGMFAWWRLSNNDRFTAGTNFDEHIPSRFVPPEWDVNTIEIWPMNEGHGITAHAIVNSPANDGTIANGAWQSG